MADRILGIDESGTGAWAGPFYVAGVLVEDEEDFAKKCEGLLRDSKKLSDGKRRAALVLIEKHALGVFRFVGTVDAIRTIGMRETWREGISATLRHFWKELPDVFIDGPCDRKVVVPSNLSVTWEKKADDKYPSVMAASIVAKTYRNNDMIALAKDFPHYEWEVNAGYGGSKVHREAIKKYGLTPHHRPIQTFEKKGIEEAEEIDILDLLGG